MTLHKSILVIFFWTTFHAAFSQVEQARLQEIDRKYKAYRLEADARIQKYLSTNPGTRGTFHDNNSTYLMVDVSESGTPIFVKTDNAQVAASLNVNQLRLGGTLGLNLLGTGVKLATWDGGKVRSDHVELIGAGRVTQVDGSSTLDDHATHTTGTIMATGINPDARGMAPEATILAYDFSNDVTEMTQVVKPDQTSIILSNHSYGIVSGWDFSSGSWVWRGDAGINPNIDYKFGYYDNQSAQWDAIALNSPYYLIVKSAGNDRSDAGNGTKPADCSPFGYDCVSTFGVAKNILTIGAVMKLPGGSYSGPSGVVMTSFSGWGPTDDGRIKPELVAPGQSVLSSISTTTTSYSFLSGTSMATPAVTGSLTLLQQLHRNLNGGNYMRSATLKALAIHSAREAGSSPGPDYAFGFGLLDDEAAAKIILSKDDQNIFIKEGILVNGQAFEMNLAPKAGTKVTATLVWTDPAGLVTAAALNSPAKKLVNDLDLRLVDNGGTSQFPWILDPANPSVAATTGDNDRDNVEKLEFSNAQAITYKLRVTNKGSLQGGTQAFSLILTYSSVVDPLVTYHWIGNSGSWTDGAHWSLTSGGSPASIVPGANDRVVFDENSFSAPSTIQINSNQSCYSIRWFANQYAVDFSLNGNTLTIGENLMLLTSKITTSTQGSIALVSNSTTPLTVDLNSNLLDKLSLVFDGNANWKVNSGNASIAGMTLNKGTVSLSGNFALNQLSATGVAGKTLALNSTTLKALQNLSIDFTGISLQIDNTSSIAIFPTFTHTIIFSSLGFQGLVDMQGGDVSLTGTGEVRSIQGNGIVRLNGALLISNLNLSGGSQLILQQGSTQTFTDKMIFVTSASSRVAIKSSGSGIANFALNDYYKICFNNIDVTNVDVIGTSVVSAGPGGALTNSQHWLTANCDDISFSDFTMTYTCLISTVYFLDKSSGPVTSRAWSFGDAGSSQNTSSLTNPTHYYSTGGPFTATLTVNGTLVRSKTVTLQANDLVDNTVLLSGTSLFSTVAAPQYQWLKEGVSINNATSRTYNFNGIPGEYAVLIFSATCNKKSAPFIVTAVEDDQPITAASRIKIYPNPTSEVLQIESDVQVMAVSVMDAVGRQNRLEFEPLGVGRYRVNVSTIPTGLYIIKISTLEKTDLQKIIIRK